MNRLAVHASVLLGLTLLAAGAVVRAEESGSTRSVDAARSTLEKWVETQTIISREKKDWQQGKEILVSRIEAVKKEIAQIEERLKQARADKGEADKVGAGLAAQRQAISDVTDALSVHIGDLEAKVRVLYRTLPESLKEKLRALYQRMPEDPAHARVTLAERFQNVLGILNEMNRLNSEVTVATEIRPLSDGKPSEVRTIYVGLGQAYFVSARGEAGVGRPSTDGWTWKKDDAISRDVNLVLEILQSKSSPQFVPLPVDIR
jgi:predicted RNase H-like nuclease (RuvC/YqgF family)